MIRKMFLFYLQDTATGLRYYRDVQGNLQKANAATCGFPVELQSAPLGWLKTELGFQRSPVYYGMQRTFSTPMELVEDAAWIARELMYKGRGVESQVTMIVFKYNDQPTPGQPVQNYKLYYKGQLDFSKLSDILVEGVKVNMLEGGLTQFIKNFENVVFELPCDGTLAQNVKILFDGLYYPSTIYYTIPDFIYNQGSNTAVQALLPSVVSNTEGDTFGVVSRAADLQFFTTFAPGNFTNFHISSTTGAILTMQGSVVITNTSPGGYPLKAVVYVYTSKGNQYFLSPTGVINQLSGTYIPGGSTVQCSWDTQITLEPGEQAFVGLQITSADFVDFGAPTIISFQVQQSTFSIQLNTYANATSVWGIPARDVLDLLIQNANELATTTEQNFNYKAISTLLDKHREIVITCGDALRASGDPNYGRYFNTKQTVLGNGVVNQYNSYGPVIKTSIKDFFTAMSVELSASLGNQQLKGQDETVFLESIQYAFDNTATPYEIGEAASVECAFSEDWSFSDLEIGYRPQSYDQKNGKYEYNTTAKWKAPIKMFTKKLSLISPYRRDTYGIEVLRANLSDTSTTRNDSDTSVFAVNVDLTKKSFDYFLAKYEANDHRVPPDGGNDMQVLQPNRLQQPISMIAQSGDYFDANTDSSIFVLNQLGLVNTSMPLNFWLSGTLNGNPANALTGLTADYCTISLCINGVVEQTWETMITSSQNAPILIGSVGSPIVITRNWNYKDVVYIKISTSANGVATIQNGSVTIGTTYVIAPLSGGFTIDGGTPQVLLPFSSVSGDKDGNGYFKATTSYQYFVFNQRIENDIFDIVSQLTGWIPPATGQHGQLDIYYNGVPIASAFEPSATGQYNPLTMTYESLFNFPTGINLKFGDIIFFTAGAQNFTLYMYSLSFKATSRTTVAYGLLREKYDTLNGIPLLSFNSVTGLPDSSIAGAPYNIKGVTPERILENWFPYIAGALVNQQNRKLSFQALDKNQFLVTVKGSEVHIENADINIASMGAPFFYPYVLTIKTSVPDTFAETLTGARNALIHFTFQGMDFYGFPLNVKQMPALNESQTWTLLLSSLTPLANIANINIDGLKTFNMGPNSSSCSFLSSLQFTLENQIMPAKYHTKNRDTYLFNQQVCKWLNQTNYWQPVQIADVITLQFVTRDLSTVQYNLYDCTGKLIANDNFTPATSNGIDSNTYNLFVAQIDTNIVVGGNPLPAGQYYVEVICGTGGSAVYYLSEGLDVQEDQPDTILVEYTSSRNIEGYYFDASTTNNSMAGGFVASFRVKAHYGNRFNQKYKGAFYVDQPQDIRIQNAIPYEVTKIWIGSDDGVPDWVFKKVARALLLDGCMIEGEGFSLDEGAEWETTDIEGNPKRYLTIDIRPSKNKFGIVANATGVDATAAMIVTANAQAFLPNVNNESAVTNPEITDMNINND